MDKKGQGLSLSTVIIAIIVLMVLVVLILVFTGGINNIFVKGVKSNDCVTQGGNCVAAANCGSSDINIYSDTSKCSAEKPVCCKKALIP